MYEEDFDDDQKEIRNKRLQVRMNEKEIESLKELSEITGADMSDIVRIGIELYRESYFKHQKM